MIKLAVDAMGGDLGSRTVIDAVSNYLKEHDDVEFYVVGKKEELTELEGKVTIVDARDVMGMEDGALTIFVDNEHSNAENNAIYAARYIVTVIDKLLNIPKILL